MTPIKMILFVSHCPRWPRQFREGIMLRNRRHFQNQRLKGLFTVNKDFGKIVCGSASQLYYPLLVLDTLGTDK